MKTNKSAAPTDPAPRSGPVRSSGTQFIIRWIGPPLEKRIEIKTSAQVREIWKEFVASQPNFDGSKENIIVIGLDVRNHFLGWHLVGVGSANGVGASLREIFRAVLAIDALQMIVVHNHPSGVVTPSPTDERFTRDLMQKCEALGVGLVDHVIVDSEGTDAFSIRGGYPEMFGDAVPEKSSSSSRPSPLRSSELIEGVVPLPRPFFWNRGREVLVDALANRVNGRKSHEWVKMWEGGNHLKNQLERAKSFRIQKPVRVKLPRADFHELCVAAAQISESVESLLAAIAGDVDISLTTWEKVEAHKQGDAQAAPANVLAFTC